ncbi:Inhibitor_I29 domain-containing protein [Caenorhabditis elegans]|uniref:Inhibitor_I29 domain-containing protein n=1 Tax=Caenorhabditis elegans TaxID=6239 RepID=Q18399_CAEEL|nr:Inhibitor_I29 domain-containing protein [Caenorhabditis elegans]CCD66528.1 Inhibitor_I29 domain-containing protein [Caenorhabditis elegans]|eukprot:NP_504773.1 Uncharacterized protein CELE_C33G8.4 [Caenorhabditis elegans]
MCRFLVALLFTAISVYAGAPTAEEAKAEVVAAGVSEAAADGILKIAETYKGQFEAAKGDREAGKNVFHTFHAEVDKYMETQSEDDQIAYKAFVDKKKAELQKRNSTPKA